MKLVTFKSLMFPAFALAGMMIFSSCTVDQEAALFSSGSAAGEKKKEKTTSVKTETTSWAEKMKAAREEREKERVEAEKKKARELASKKKQDEADSRKLAAEKKKEEAARKALADKQAREKAKAEADKKALAEKKAKEKADEKSSLEKKLADAKKKREEERAAKLAAKKKAEEASAKLAAKKKAEDDAAKLAAKKKEEQERAARLAAKKKAEEERAARRVADSRSSRSNEVAAVANRRGGGGFFSSLAVSTPTKYKSKGHHVKINNRLLGGLNSSNAKVEISLGEQRARIYKTSGGMKQLVIETQISSGKSGHTTPTGSFRIKEKLEHKRSTLYGRWVNSSGQTIRSDGDSRHRPSGGTTFVGAEMPYWMRITGGIGMHIGYVPSGPASHGCIRVPPTVQPLIFSKVGVGTPVTITH